MSFLLTYSHTWLTACTMRTGLALIAVWFVIGETHRGEPSPPALTLPHVRYGLRLLLAVCCTHSGPSICRHVQYRFGRQ